MFEGHNFVNIKRPGNISGLNTVFFCKALRNTISESARPAFGCAAALDLLIDCIYATKRIPAEAVDSFDFIGTEKFFIGIVDFLDAKRTID